MTDLKHAITLCVYMAGCYLIGYFSALMAFHVHPLWGILVLLMVPWAALCQWVQRD